MKCINGLKFSKIQSVSHSCNIRVMVVYHYVVKKQKKASVSLKYNIRRIKMYHIDIKFYGEQCIKVKFISKIFRNYLTFIQLCDIILLYQICARILSGIV